MIFVYCITCLRCLILYLPVPLNSLLLDASTLLKLYLVTNIHDDSALQFTVNSNLMQSTLVCNPISVEGLPSEATGIERNA